MAEKINVLVGADVTPLQSGMKEAVSVIKQSGQQITAASEQVAATSGTAYKSLQQAYRQTYKDAQILAQQQGVNSDAFKEAAKKAANYKDELEDVQDAIKGASAEQQWKNVSSAIGSAMNIAQGFVGVMSLIGGESESTTKALTQMMALAGIANAIESVNQLKDSFVALNAVTQTSIIGIAALVAGLVIYNSTVEDTEEITARFKKLGEEGWKAISESANASMAIENARLSTLKDGYEKEIAIENSRSKWKKRSLEDLYNQQKIEFLSYIMWQNAENAKHDYEVEKINQKHKDTLLDQEKNTEKKKLDVLKDGRDKSLAIEDWYHKWELSNLTSQKEKGLLEEKYYNSQVESEKHRHINAVKKINQTTPPKYNGIYGAGGVGAPKTLSDVSEEMKKASKEISATLSYLETNTAMAAFAISEDAKEIANGLAAGINAAVQAAMSGGDVGKALASTLLASMGAFMVQWGTQLIAVGIGAEALKASLASLNGIGAILAGAALVALGGAAIGMAANFSRTKGEDTGNANTSYTTGSYPQPAFANTSTLIEVGGIVRGNDLRIVLNNNNRQVKRVR